MNTPWPSWPFWPRVQAVKVGFNVMDLTTPDGLREWLSAAHKRETFKVSDEDWTRYRNAMSELQREQSKCP